MIVKLTDYLPTTCDECKNVVTTLAIVHGWNDINPRFCEDCFCKVFGMSIDEKKAQEDLKLEEALERVFGRKNA